MVKLFAVRGPCEIHSPHERGHPSDASLDDDDLEIRELAEHALEHQTRHLLLERCRHAGVIFEVVRGKADARSRMRALCRSEVDPDGQAAFRRSSVDWPILASTEGFHRPGE